MLLAYFLLDYAAVKTQVFLAPQKHIKCKISNVKLPFCDCGPPVLYPYKKMQKVVQLKICT